MLQLLLGFSAWQPVLPVCWSGCNAEGTNNRAGSLVLDFTPQFQADKNNEHWLLVRPCFGQLARAGN